MVSTVSVDGPPQAQVRVIPLRRCLSLRDECELYGPIVDKLHFDVVREVHAGDVVEPRVYESPAAVGGEVMRKPLPFGMVIEGGRHELITWDRVTGTLQVTDIMASGQMLVEIPPDRCYLLLHHGVGKVIDIQHRDRDYPLGTHKKLSPVEYPPEVRQLLA